MPMIMIMLLSALPDDWSFDNAAAELVTITLAEGGGGEGGGDGGGEIAVLVTVGLTNTLVATPFAARAV